MRPKIGITVLVALAVSASVLVKTARARTTTPGEMLKIDVDKPMQVLNQTVRSAKPLQKTLAEALPDLKKKIEALRDGKDVLARSAVERAYARVLLKVTRDMDQIIRNRDAAEWAVKDISGEVKRVLFRLQQNKIKGEVRMDLTQRRLDELKTRLKELRRKFEREKPKVSPATMREIRTVAAAYKIQKRNLEYQQSVARQIAAILKTLGALHESTEQFAARMQAWFEVLVQQRNATRELAESRSELVRLSQLMTSPGAGQALVETSRKLAELSDSITQLGKVMDKIGEIDKNGLPIPAEIMNPDWERQEKLFTQKPEESLKEIESLFDQLGIE